MGLLYILSYLAAAAALIFITLSLASGLLWIAERIEEHPRMAKTIGQRAIWAVIILHLVLYFDGLPLTHLLFSIFCHFIYSRNITPRWPLISLKSPFFILSCILVFIDHFLFFTYFAHESNLARQRMKTYGYRGSGNYGKNASLARVRGFGEIATFFALCVWAVPLFLFLGLSANENALPTQIDNFSSQAAHSESRKPRQRSSLLKRVLDPVLSILPGARHLSTDDPDLAPALQQETLTYFGSSGMAYPTGGINGTSGTVAYNPADSLPSPGLVGSNTVYSPSGRASPFLGDFSQALASPPPPRVRKTPRIASNPQVRKED